MKVGDLVRSVPYGPTRGSEIDHWANQTGIIVGFIEELDAEGLVTCQSPVVYWNSEFHSEVEYREQVEVVSVAIPKCIDPYMCKLSTNSV